MKGNFDSKKAGGKLKHTLEAECRKENYFYAPCFRSQMKQLHSGRSVQHSSPSSSQRGKNTSLLRQSRKTNNQIELPHRIATFQK